MSVRKRFQKEPDGEPFALRGHPERRGRFYRAKVRGQPETLGNRLNRTRRDVFPERIF